MLHVPAPEHLFVSDNQILPSDLILFNNILPLPQNLPSHLPKLHQMKRSNLEMNKIMNYYDCDCQCPCHVDDIVWYCYAMITVPQVPGPEPHQGAGQGSSGGSDTSEERRGGGRGRGRVTRHISIDDTPITHTYHQPNSLDTSSDSSHSPEEVSQALGSFVPIIMLLGESLAANCWPEVSPWINMQMAARRLCLCVVSAQCRPDAAASWCS